MVYLVPLPTGEPQASNLLGSGCSGVWCSGGPTAVLPLQFLSASVSVKSLSLTPVPGEVQDSAQITAVLVERASTSSLNNLQTEQFLTLFTLGPDAA